MRSLLLELLLLTVLGIGTAFTYNTLRQDGRIKPTKNYFDKGAGAPTSAAPAATTRQEVKTAAPTKTTNVTHAQRDDGAKRSQSQGSAESAAAADALKPKSEKHPVHNYQDITFEQLLELVNDPLTASGLNVLIDARNEDRFAEGHIVGARLCNPYQVEKYRDQIEDAVLNAEKVVVYCGGGDCEDSIFMCRELLEMHVAPGAIYLYAGGWKEWELRNGPTATDEQ